MRYTSHLDLHRAWERAFRRADLPLAYSQGYNPRPKINLASALPLGFTSNGEVLDARLEKQIPLAVIAASLNEALPPGIQLDRLEEIDPREPALQRQIQSSEYLITFLDPFPELPERVQQLLAREQIKRERRGKVYDLRPLVEKISPLSRNEQGQQQISVQLAAREGATGRPEELISALGYDPLAARVERSKIIFK
jgi:radical SAM-linked protein